MKKLSLLILLVLVASLLVAAIPTKIVRLVVINKSGFDVFMKLEGSELTEAFYYLTIPAGTRDVPTVKIFTIMVDYYTRTTWQCNGLETSGSFFVSQNMRLVFTPCFDMPCWGYRHWPCTWFRHDWGCPGQICNQTASSDNDKLWITKVHAGEPTMEKVTYFKWTAYYHMWRLNHLWGGPNVRWGWDWVPPFWSMGYWFYGCQSWIWRIRTFKMPVGCAWRYQY